LQGCDLLSNSNWIAITNTPAVVNGQNTIVLNPSGTQKFFRLQQVQ